VSPDDALVDASLQAPPTSEPTEQDYAIAAERSRARAAQRGGAPLLPPPPPGAQTGPVQSAGPTAAPDTDPASNTAQKAPEAATDTGPKEFDPRWREPFTGLAYLGHLSEEFEFWGHRFQIMTPSHLDKIDIGLLHRPYADTLSSELVFATAMTAAYLKAIDGRDLPQPIVNDPKETALHERFRWVSENLRQPVINRIYNRCLALEEQVEGVLAAMGEARG
jgi:hypothetical protein